MSVAANPTEQVTLTADLAAVGAVQASWTDDGLLFFWASEERELPALDAVLTLPPGVASEGTRVLAVRRTRTSRREVQGYLVPISDAILPLAALDHDVALSGSVLCFSQAAKLALELAARKRAVPTVSDGEARWAALLSQGPDRSRAEEIALSLPPAGRAVPVGERPLRLRPSILVVRSFLDGAVDAIYRQRAYPGPSRGWVRAWAEGLREKEATFAPKDARWQGMPERISAWASAADAPSPRVGFALQLPKKGKAVFPLEVVLHAPGAPDHAVGIDEAWNAGSDVVIEGKRFPRPAEAAVRGLARAAKLHPALRACLAGAKPQNLMLDAAQAWAFLDEGRPALKEAGFEVRLPADFERAGSQRIRAQIRLGSPRGPNKALGDSLAYRWEVVVGDELLTGDEFAKLSKVEQPIVKWRGTWVFLDPAELERLPEDLTETGLMPLPEALRAVFTGEHEGVPVIADEGLQLLIDALREPPQLDPPPRLQATLRGYQVTGYSWLTTLGELGLGSLLADDMGLGKTLQLIAHILSRADSERYEPRPSLVICPTSVLGNWEREIERFAPALEVLRWHGHQRGGEPLGDVDVVLTTYGLLVRDADLLASHEWDVVALDEAQSIKNPDSQRAKAARRLQARHRVALTGTPVENRLDELWSVMQFLVPGMLGARRRFQREVAVPIERFGDDEVAARLRRTVAPFLLRRVKTDPNVISDLPEKVESVDYCVLTKEQRDLYESEVELAMEEIKSASEMERRGRVLAMLTALKQICNHPVHYLRKRDENADLSLEGRSGKLERLTQRIEAIQEVGERAVVFTQYREMGDLLQSHISELVGARIPFLHGGTPAHTRDEMVRSFQEDDWAAPVLLVSLRAGGTGLNLTRATHVMHYDRWWNPAVEDQATDRAYRIGQRQTVLVYKLVCEGTLEERIDQLLDEKRALFKTVVGSGERWVTELNDDQLRALVMLGSEAPAAKRKKAS